MSSNQPDKQPKVRHYDANYRNYQSELYQQIRKEAFGEDIGQNSWLTADEQDRFIPLLNLSAEKMLLDVACGSGGPLLRIAKKTACTVVGIDVHQDAISTANQIAASEGITQRAHFRIVDAGTQLPFDDASFDAITCIDAINHLPDRSKVVREWTRILKPRGRLLFTDPITVTGWLSATEIAIRSSIGYFLFVPEHYDETVIRESGLQLLLREDVTHNMAVIAERRRAAREGRSSELRAIEGVETYEGQQEFLRVASQLATERRLSRFVFVAEKTADAIA